MTEKFTLDSIHTQLVIIKHVNRNVSDLFIITCKPT